MRLTSGLSYKASMLLNYDSRVIVINSKLLIFMTPKS